MTSFAHRRPSRIHARTTAGAVALLALIALGAGGCGRRGALEPPPNPNAVAKADTNDATHPQIAHKPKPVVPPKQPFFLDFLL